MQKEIWKPIPNIEYFNNVQKYYMMSTLGKCKTFNGKLLKSRLGSACSAIPCYSLNKIELNSKTRKININILMALTFMYRPDFKNHKILYLDGNFNNNNIFNLIWDDGLWVDNKKYIIHKSAKPTIESLPGEIWLPIPAIGELSIYNTMGMYASNYGRIINIFNEKRMKLERTSSDDYYKINMRLLNNTTKVAQLHRIILITFNYIPGCENLQVNHIDGNKHNNNINNLEWVTCKENIRHAYINKLSYQIGSSHTESTISDDTIYKVLDDYLSNNLTNTNIINKYNISIFYDLLCGRTRLNTLIDYLISKGINNPMDVFNEFEINNMKLIINNCNTITEFRENLKLLPNTIKYLVSAVIYQVYKNNNTWVDGDFNLK